LENVAHESCLAGSVDVMIEAFLPDTEGLLTSLTQGLESFEGITCAKTRNVLRTDKSNYMWEGENVGLGPAQLPKPASCDAQA